MGLEKQTKKRKKRKSDEWLALLQKEQRIQRKVVDLEEKLAREQASESWRERSPIIDPEKLRARGLAWIKYSERTEKELSIQKRALELIQKRRAALEARASNKQLAVVDSENQASLSTDANSTQTRSESVSVQVKKVEPVQETVGQTTATRRKQIDDFISKVRESGRKITRKHLWTAAGYKDATEFERYQREDSRTTKSAATTFNRILNMNPENFSRLLEKKQTQT